MLIETTINGRLQETAVKPDAAVKSLVNQGAG
jgi:hypothetical protein